MVDGIALPPRPGCTPADAGHRALAGALSDLAAMGAEPGEAYLALVLPAGLGDDDVLALHRGAEALAARRAARRSPAATSPRGPALTVAVTVVGWADRRGRRSSGRDGARPGRPRRRDRHARRRRRPGSACSRARATGPHALVRATCARSRGWPRAARSPPPARSAMIDLSDGLASDAAPPRASAAACGSCSTPSALPLAAGVAEVAAQLGTRPGELAATGGEDYELCACVPPAARGGGGGGRVTWIGEVGRGPGPPRPRRSAAARLRARRWRGYEHARWPRRRPSASRGRRCRAVQRACAASASATASASTS